MGAARREQRLLPRGLVFESHRTGVNFTSLEAGFKKACELANIPYGMNTPSGLTLHGLRHTFATRLRERGVHELDIMALLGHSSVRMTVKYSHSSPEAMCAAIQRLEGRGDILEFSLRQKSTNRPAEAQTGQGRWS